MNLSLLRPTVPSLAVLLVLIPFSAAHSQTAATPNVPPVTLTDGGANCLYRSGTPGRDLYRTATIPTTDLKAGQNVLALTLPAEKMWAMYDFLRMEEKATP